MLAVKFLAEERDFDENRCCANQQKVGKTCKIWFASV